jgi:phage tail sheath protein FI
MIARAERAYGVGRAPANLPASMVLGPDRAVDADEWALLHGVSMNVFRPLPTRGAQLLGARTLSSDRDYRYLHVRRLITHIVRRLQRRMVWAAFEPHTPSLRERVRRDVEAHILRPLFQRGAFAGDSPKTSYFVRCDEALNPRASQDQGRLITEIGVAPNIPAEFIVLSLETSRERGLDIVERS